MLRWAEENGTTVKQLAEAAGCTDAHMRNILAGRREASLRMAKRLMEFSGGKVPMDTFLKPEVDEARA